MGCRQILLALPGLRCPGFGQCKYRTACTMEVYSSSAESIGAPVSSAGSASKLPGSTSSGRSAEGAGFSFQNFTCPKKTPRNLQHWKSWRFWFSLEIMKCYLKMKVSKFTFYQSQWLKLDSNPSKMMKNHVKHVWKSQDFRIQHIAKFGPKLHQNSKNDD